MGKSQADLVLKNIGQLLTMAPSDGPKRGRDARNLGIVEDAFLASKEGKIVALGANSSLGNQVDLLPNAEVVDVKGRVVAPGFVDAHTHLVFGGWRYEEYALRCQGASYLEIAERGGGIMSTVRATRNASREELLQRSLGFLDEMLQNGTTSCETKSGYGLDLQNELKQLEVIRECNKLHSVDLVPTFLGAHAMPPEFANDRQTYIDEVVSMLEPVKNENLAEFVDVFCDVGNFTIDESRYILEQGIQHGLMAKIHADELENTGATELGCDLGAISCDHLIKVSPKGIEKLASSNTIAVLLPATSCYLGEFPGAPGRRMLDSGVCVALGTDFNPGTSTAMSMPLCMTLACSMLGFSPEEAFIASTWNAAWASNLGGVVGGIDRGFVMDVVVFDASDYREIPYRFGTNLVDTVIKRGEIVVEKNKG